MKVTSGDSLEGPITCDVCGKKHPKKLDAGRDGWDWFHGYLDRTHHFCPKCIQGRTYYKMKVLSEQKP